MGLGAFSLLAGLGAPLAAQTLWTPASDPVGIARSGTGVAYGTSLEAASLNPALLVTMREDTSAFLAAGQELQSSQATIQSNSQVLFSDDRNRLLEAFGASWKVRPGFYLGLKLDKPFLRHVAMPSTYGGRFLGQDLSIDTHRLEVQGAWAYSPALSFGASLGLTQVKYSFENCVRIEVPNVDPAAPVNPVTNPVRGLMELGLAQQGSKTLPSYTFGFRWAISPRWTLGGAYQGPIKGTLPISARIDDGHTALVGINGYGPADAIATPAAPLVQAASTLAPGDGGITLPGRFSLGLRQRLNQFFTWEGDLHYVQNASLQLPGYASLATPSGTVSGQGLPGSLHSGMGLSLMGEMALTKTLTGRMGLSQEAGAKQDPSVEPLLGGSRTSTFSAGLGLRMFGGEASVGWMTRISQDRDVKDLDGVWAASGYSTSGTLTRVENMGHMWSLGFRRSF